MNEDPSQDPDEPEPSKPEPSDPRPSDSGPSDSGPSAGPSDSGPSAGPSDSGPSELGPFKPSGDPGPPPASQPPASPGSSEQTPPSVGNGPQTPPPTGNSQQTPPPTGYGPQTPPPAGYPAPPQGYGRQGPYGQQPPPPYGYGPATPPGGYGQQPPPYGYGPATPPYGYGQQPPPPYGYVDPANPWAQYQPGAADPLVSADYSGWWNRSFRLLKAAWLPLAGVQLFSVLPIIAVTVIAAMTLGRGTTEQLGTVDNDPQAAFHRLLLTVLAETPVLLAGFVLGLVVPLAMIHVLVQTATGRPVSVPRALLAGLRRILPMLGWNILASLMIVVGLLFCVLPGLYFAAALALLHVIILLEPGQGIGRSFQLFHNDVGAALGRLATMVGLGLGVGIASAIASAVIAAASASGPTGVQVLLTALVSGVFSLVSAVVLAPMYLTTYADLRARREPFSTANLVTA